MQRSERIPLTVTCLTSPCNRGLFFSTAWWSGQALTMQRVILQEFLNFAADFRILAMCIEVRRLILRRQRRRVMKQLLDLGSLLVGHS